MYVVIETPKHSHAKFTYNPQGDFFELGKILPAGNVFPLNFGFIPHTRGGDGDPLDVLVLLDTPLPMGAVLKCRLVGVMLATQKEDKEKIRNDRLIAIPIEAQGYKSIKSAADIDSALIDEVVQFFEHYNAMRNKVFKLVGLKNKNAALKLVKQSLHD